MREYIYGDAGCNIDIINILESIKWSFEGNGLEKKK